MTTAGGNAAGAADKQFLRMGKAASSILNKNGLDMMINKQSPQGTPAGTGPQNSTNNPDIFTEIRNSQSPYWTSSGGGTVEEKYSSLALQDNHTSGLNTGRETVEAENSYGLASSFAVTKPTTGAAAGNNLHHSPSQEMI